SRADSLDVVRAARGDLEDPVAEAIVEKADGNPLFLEQLALHAGETPDGRSVGMVPNTIHDVVMARLDRLPSETKQLLQTASLINSAAATTAKKPSIMRSRPRKKRSGAGPITRRWHIATMRSAGSTRCPTAKPTACAGSMPCSIRLKVDTLSANTPSRSGHL